MKSEFSREHETNLANVAEAAEPSLYQVTIHKDDFTPIEFIVGTLEKFFYMDRRKAASLMLKVRTEGKAVCGVYSKDSAKTKVVQVVGYARQHEHPLFCSMEIA